MATDTCEPAVTEVDRPIASPLDHRLYLTVDHYYQWIEAGVFKRGEPYYLWKGWLVEKMTKNQPHVIAISKLNTRLVRIVPDGWYVAPEAPIAMGDSSAPEPDLTVIRGRPEDYPRRPPTTGQVALLIEVADSSLAEDQGDVLREYARHGIPVYWIVNIPHRRIEVHTEPTGPADTPIYRAIRHYLPGDEIPVVLDGNEVGRVAVADVLP